jgi:glycosyltransferase involved in cell wall biosynthesis
MKILIFYQYFGTPQGGWSTRYYEFTRRWVKAGHQVTVVTSPYYKSDIKPKGFVSRQMVEGVELIVINSPDSNKDSFSKRAWNAIRFALVSCFYAIKEPHDLVLSSSGPITAALPGLLSKWFRGKKMVFEVRDLWPSGGIEMGKLRNPWLVRMALAFERKIYSDSDLVVACSEGMEKGVLAVRHDCPTIVIPNSSDVDLFHTKSSNLDFPVGFPKGIPILLYAGSLGEMDDCSQILMGLGLVKNYDFRMVFIGDGTERRHLEQLTAQLGLDSKVSFLGLIPKTEVVKWFAVSRASFVTFKNLPILHTNSPNKLFDSFAAGVPVIQTTQGWIAALIDREKCGITADADSPRAMADAIEILLGNPDRAEEMGQAALRIAKGQFNREVLAENYRLAMERLVV